MCLRSRVLKPSSQKEMNSAGESCGSWLCGCGSRALALGGRAEHLHLLQHCQEPLQLSPGSHQFCLCHSTVGRALHSHLWCQHLEQTHPDHTCVTERPSAGICPIFWLKSYDCPAAFESCDITVSNSYIYIYMYIDTTTS